MVRFNPSVAVVLPFALVACSPIEVIVSDDAATQGDVASPDTEETAMSPDAPDASETPSPSCADPTPDACTELNATRCTDDQQGVLTCLVNPGTGCVEWQATAHCEALETAACAVSACDAGACAETLPCAPYACNEPPRQCLTGCTQGADCAPGFACRDAQCRKLANGEVCDSSGASLCASGYCSNAYCCDGGACCAVDSDCLGAEGFDQAQTSDGSFGLLLKADGPRIGQTITMGMHGLWTGVDGLVEGAVGRVVMVEVYAGGTPEVGPVLATARWTLDQGFGWFSLVFEPGLIVEGGQVFTVVARLDPAQADCGADCSVTWSSSKGAGDFYAPGTGWETFGSTPWAPIDGDLMFKTRLRASGTCTGSQCQ